MPEWVIRRVQAERLWLFKLVRSQSAYRLLLHCTVVSFGCDLFFSVENVLKVDLFVDDRFLVDRSAAGQMICLSVWRESFC